MLKLAAEISIAKLEDRKTVTAILHENGYTVGPGKRKKTRQARRWIATLKFTKRKDGEMMDEVSFEIMGEPKGKGRPRFVRATGRAITPKDTVDYENLVKMEYVYQCKGKRFADDAQIGMTVYAYYSIPKSVGKKKREAMLRHELRPTKKPDSSNVLKAIEDALNGIAYRDDAQIVETRISRYYGEQPRVEVIIKKI